VKKGKSPKKREPALTPIQKRFIEEYLVDLNGTKAAMRAGYGKKGAHVRASALIKIPLVRKAIDDAIAARSKRTEITQDLVLKELYNLVVANLDDYDSGGRVKPGVRAEAIKAIAGLERTILTSGEEAKLVKIKIRLWDKTRALNLAMRHLGMLNDKLTLSVDEELEKRITNAASDYERRMAELATRARKNAAP
jgi:phage terminase small subunit